MRCLLCALCLSVVASTGAGGQILRVSELSVRDIAQLDRDGTVVMIPGGVLEEHGPFLPAFTDGYLSDWVANRVAEALLPARGGTILMFPMIPLGVGSPEDFAGQAPFSGSYTVRPETLRAVYMDLASALGNVSGYRRGALTSASRTPSLHQCHVGPEPSQISAVFPGANAVSEGGTRLL